MATSTTGKKKTTRKTGTKSTSASRSRKTTKAPSMTKEQFALRQEIKAIIVFAFAILLFACNFGVIGKFGNFLSGIMFGLFGVMAYIFPLLLGGCIVYLQVNMGSAQAVRKSVAGFALILAIGNLIDLFTGISSTATVYSIKDFFMRGFNEHNGGGVISASVVFGLKALIEKAGTVIFSIVIIIVCIIIITEKSLIKGVRETTEKLRETTEETRDYREQLRQEQMEENRRRIEERNQRAEERRLAEEEQRKATVAPITLTASEPSEVPDERIVEAADRLKLLNSKDEMKADKEILKKNRKLAGITDDNLLRPVIDLRPANNLGDMHEIVLDNFDPATLEFSEPERTEEVRNDEIRELTPEVKPAENEYKAPVIKTAEPKISEPKAKPADEKIDIKAEIEASKASGEYVFPPIKLLKAGSRSKANNAEHIKETSAKLVNTLRTFGIDATVTDTSVGPTVTRYELSIGEGTKVSKVRNLTDDIKLSLAATDIRMEVPIPGKSAIGIEIPNKDTEAVKFRDLIDNSEFKDNKSNLAFAVGKDIAGKNIIYDIDQFPHLLIAGATGSGKSVCINTLIMSILYKADPDDVKLIMIDPKVVELSVYNGIPHLLLPVVTDAKKASATLNFAVAEMMERYKKFADMNTRDLAGYNRAVSELPEDDPCKEMHKKLPRIVIIVDELADLIMVAKNEVEDAICRIAQLARACGIHLIIATQRPSVDVITGLIKANMPSRIAFAVSSGIDSRTILDMTGAEELLGRGDMLFFPKGLKKPVRLQGGYVSDDEVNDVVAFLKAQGTSSYDAGIDEKINSMAQANKSGGSLGSSDDGEDSDVDDRFIEAGRFVIESNKASIGHLQRKFKMGFNRAARLMDQLYEAGVVGPEEGTKPREVLMSLEQFDNYIENEL
ncbi:MAG: DNA translocase FtsK [Lachnospiraceae bacterium]|nr:DNA translocase FtsK [Lachnospiraceae bacterium]